MGGSKLKSLHIVIIGSFACALVVAGLYFLIIKKQYQQLGALNTQYQQLSQEYARKAQAEARLAEAKEKNRIVLVKYDKYLREKMPPITFQDRAQGMIALWKEQAEVLGPMLQSWPRRTGVILANNVQVPPAPVNPNAIDPTLITIPIGSFTVRGDFSTILSHLRSWNKFNRLVRIDVGRLTGPSPGMQADYSVTVFIFPRGEAGQNIVMAGGGPGEAGMAAPAPMGMPPGGAPPAPIGAQGDQGPIPGTPAGP